MIDPEFNKQVRKEIKQAQKLFAKLTPEVLVMIPDLLTDELNKRSEEMYNEDKSNS